MLASSAVRAQVPTVPMRQETLPILDGVIRNGEWQQALVLQATNSKIDPITKFYLQHDGSSLWVAVDSDEPDNALPMAVLRAPGSVLSTDDAVEVAIGTEGGNERTISMGGYAGAMAGKIAPMEHLYGFVVNAAGSTTRRYNEMELPTALFEAKVSRRAKGWQAEMRIPFSSLGLKQAAGREFFANFVRYRPPIKLGWKGMANWGGYSPFPTARLRLAATTDEIAVGGEQNLPRPQLATSQDFEQTFDAVKTPSLEYFPLSNTVCGQVHVRPGGKAVLKAAGATKEELSPLGGIVRLILELPRQLKDGESTEAELASYKADGSVDFQQKQAFKGSITPAWSGTEVARQYVDNAIPTPWAKPIAAGKTVQLTHAALTFGNSSLPTSIKTAGNELLAAPIAIQLWANGKIQPIKWAEPVMSTVGVRPVISSNGLFGANLIEVRTEIDFDGFMTVQLRLKGKPQQIDRVQISCPLQISRARYLAERNVQNVVTLDGKGYKGTNVGRYGGRYWMGAEDGGLTFSTDLPFFKAAQRRGEVAVVDNGNARSLLLTPIDQANQITNDTTLQFYLQASPTRPQSKVTMDDYWLWFEEWSDYQGYPDLAKMDQVKERVKKAHSEAPYGKKDLPYLLYFNQLLAENTPDFDKYRKELIAPPERNWYQRAYDPGKGIPSYLCCVRGPYGDLLLDGIQKLADEGDIGGVYMDGTTVGWACDNPAHTGCNELRAPVWGEPGETRILGTRKFLKRLRGIFDARNKPFYLVAHTGGDLDINTLSLADQMWEGEQLARYLPGYRVPQSQFAVGYSGAPWGYRTMFFDNTWLGQRGLNWSLVYDLLYNVDNQRYGARPFLRPFEVPGSTFHPYWKDGQQLVKSSKTGKSKASYYTAPNAVLVAVSNLDTYSDEVTLDLSKFKEVQDKTWVDLYTGKSHTVENGLLSLTLQSYQGVGLRPLSQTTEAEREPALRDLNLVSVPDVNEMNPEAWTVNEEAKGIGYSNTPGADGANWKIIKSDVGGASVSARLAGAAIGQDAEVTLKLKAPSGPIMQLDVGPISLVHEGSWQIRGAVDGWNEANVHQIPWAVDQEIELKLIFHNNDLTILVDGQPLVDHMTFRNDGLGLRPLQIWTIAGHSLAFRLVRLSSKPDLTAPKEVRHPVDP